MRWGRSVAGLGRIGVVCLVVAVGSVGAQPGDGGPRRIVVLSDLHLGEGRDVDGAWSPHEDFRWAEDFDRFLTALAAEDSLGTDLILNGDTFELARSSEVACDHARPDLGCTESEALARLERVLQAHTAAMASLGTFARGGDNRVVMVPGEEDAALLFPEVGARAVAAFGVPAGRVMVAMAGLWRSADGRVLVEHGHQLVSRADRFNSWPLPFLEQGGQRHLRTTPGQQTLQPLVDAYESRFAIVDNVADETAGLRFALSATGTDGIGDVAVPLLRELLFRFSWQQFRMDLDRGDVEAPEWQLDEVRADGAEFLLATLPDDDRLRPLATLALDAGRLDVLMATLSDDDLRAVCDHRAAVRRARRRFERILSQLDPTGPPVTECARTPTSAGPMFEYFWQSRDQVFLRHLEQRRGQGPPIAVFVHGHTHLADYRQGNFTRVEAGGTYVVDGFSPVRDAAMPVVLNGGAWQRTVTPVLLDRFAGEQGMSDRELLETVQPEQLPPCYSFVEIEAYPDLPAPPSLRYWRQDQDGKWMMAGGCGRRVTSP